MLKGWLTFITLTLFQTFLLLNTKEDILKNVDNLQIQPPLVVIKSKEITGSSQMLGYRMMLLKCRLLIQNVTVPFGYFFGTKLYVIFRFNFIKKMFWECYL